MDSFDHVRKTIPHQLGEYITNYDQASRKDQRTANALEQLRVHMQDVKIEVARTQENDADDLPLPTISFLKRTQIPRRNRHGTEDCEDSLKEPIVDDLGGQRSVNLGTGTGKPALALAVS
ncbi:MAG: hypothetical protein L6R36_004244 [Xanthoria steineri]|nr:MAG: hypothetical protein L6R36_004244 [Xanthoria steineri]